MPAPIASGIVIRHTTAGGSNCEHPFTKAEMAQMITAFPESEDPDAPRNRLQSIHDELPDDPS